jgi:hypothetical protein
MQAFAEVFEIADGGGDAYTKIANIKRAGTTKMTVDRSN